MVLCILMNRKNVLFLKIEIALVDSILNVHITVH
jgi:hypothetical protein